MYCAVFLFGNFLLFVDKFAYLVAGNRYGACGGFFPTSFIFMTLHRKPGMAREINHLPLLVNFSNDLRDLPDSTKQLSDKGNRSFQQLLPVIGAFEVDDPHIAVLNQQFAFPFTVPALVNIGGFKYFFSIAVVDGQPELLHRKGIFYPKHLIHPIAIRAKG